MSQASSAPLGRDAVGDAALLAALAEDPQQPAAAVDVVDVEADELADPDAAGVEQLEHDRVAQADRLLGAGGGLDDRAGLVGREHAGQGAVRLGADQPEADVLGREAGAAQPAR